MKGRISLALIFFVIQMMFEACSGTGSEAFIPRIVGAVFISSNEAWVLTRKGVLKHISTDGQATSVIDSQQRIQAMSFINPVQGWTVDSDWKVWNFDGIKWAFVGQNSEREFGLVQPSSVSFVDDRVGWARTLVPLFTTDDGGKTWQKVLVTGPGELKELSVVDSNTAFLYGPRGSVSRTMDRGRTWKNIDLGDVGDVTAFACRDGGRECWAGTSHGKIFAIDGDTSPKRVSFPTPKEMTITQISPTGEDAFLVSGFTLLRDENPSTLGLLVKTSDGGTTWTALEVPQDDRFVQVASFGNTIWIASETAIYRSSDAGRSWTKIYTEPK